ARENNSVRAEINVDAQIRRAVVAREVCGSGHDEVGWGHSTAGGIGPGAVCGYLQVSADGGIGTGKRYGAGCRNTAARSCRRIAGEGDAWCRAIQGCVVAAGDIQSAATVASRIGSKRSGGNRQAVHTLVNDSAAAGCAGRTVARKG